MFDIVALGESLIDFTPSGENSQGMALFARNPGGAPANVLAMAAKLGGKTAFIGKVGDDAFGAFLKKTMEDAGVDVRGLRMTREYPTTLAFVQLTPEGDRSFTFYRKPGADVMLAPACRTMSMRPSSACPRARKSSRMSTVSCGPRNFLDSCTS